MNLSISHPFHLQYTEYCSPNGSERKSGRIISANLGYFIIQQDFCTSAYNIYFRARIFKSNIKILIILNVLVFIILVRKPVRFECQPPPSHTRPAASSSSQFQCHCSTLHLPWIHLNHCSNKEHPSS